MSELFTITIVVVLLYIVYRIGGRWLLPLWQQKRLERYKKQFFDDNPHISSRAYEDRKKQQADDSSIIDHRIRKK